MIDIVGLSPKLAPEPSPPSPTPPHPLFLPTDLWLFSGIRSKVLDVSGSLGFPSWPRGES